MEVKYQITASNSDSKDKIVDGLISSGYVIGVEKIKFDKEYLISIYSRRMEPLRHVYADCYCQTHKE